MFTKIKKHKTKIVATVATVTIVSMGLYIRYCIKQNRVMFQIVEDYETSAANLGLFQKMNEEYLRVKSN